MDITKDTILETFMYHPPTEAQKEQYLKIRTWARFFAEAVLDCSPPSAERTLALRKVQEAVMWANAAIALNPSQEMPSPTLAPPEPVAPSAPSEAT